jgi:hypothetical protein
MSNMGNMAGQIRGQEYGEQANRAGAEDVINRANQTGMNAFNQQKYENQMGLASKKAAGQAGMGDLYGRREKAGMEQIGGLVDVGGKLLGRYF